MSAAPLEMGDADSAAARVQITSRYVTRDGEPWVPVMGEYHFSRDLPGRWERELRKMASGGIDVLATYVIWIVHEEIEGQVRWDAHRDLRRFVEIAGEVGLKVILRIGPWVHGEARNGGFPDWLQALPIGHRSNDPAYLTLARRWYAGIAEQVRGLFHTRETPDAPIVGIQVENELYDDGPHLATLREMAEEVGMRASLWTATGWGGADLPRGRVLPVYAGYSDGFWEESDVGWPDFGIRHLTYHSARDDLSVGADLRDAPVDMDSAAPLGADDPWPFVSCELGGGMGVAYHRRPLVDSDDVAALALTKLGSGSAWQGYYMYHGGTQVLGERTGTQESHTTGYPNDVPVRDYDFFAPIGASGAQRPHFHRLRQQHLMLDAFGHAIAVSPATIPAPAEDGLRWAVRGDGERGHLFVTHHQPAIAALPPLDDVQFTVEFDDATVTVPSVPTTLESGRYFAWPLRQRYGTIPALTATAQPLTEIPTMTGTVVLFAAVDGIDVELQLEGVPPSAVSGASVRVDDDVVIATPESAPGRGCEVRVGDTTLLFFDRATAESVWRGTVGGRDTVVIWPGDGWFDERGFTAVLTEGVSTIEVLPALQGTANEIPAHSTLFTRYSTPAAGAPIALEFADFTSRPLAPVRRGGPLDRLSAPTDGDFVHAATVELDFSSVPFGEDQRILTLDWTGDVIRAYIGEQFVADQFWHGRPLEIDLTPYEDVLRSRPLTLRAFAWSPTTGVYVDPRVRPTSDQPTLELRSAIVRPVGTVTFD